jgi:hypothetical protein
MFTLLASTYPNVHCIVLVAQWWPCPAVQLSQCALHCVGRPMNESLTRHRTESGVPAVQPPLGGFVAQRCGRPHPADRCGRAPRRSQASQA